MAGNESGKLVQQVATGLDLTAMYSMFNDEQADVSLTPHSFTLRVYRGLAALSAAGALAVWLGGWGKSVLEIVCNALWVGLSGWMGSLILCETMIVGWIVVQSLRLARCELDGRQPFGVTASLLPDFSDLRHLRQQRRVSLD
jgi:hypothetical protein